MHNYFVYVLCPYLCACVCVCGVCVWCLHMCVCVVSVCAKVCMCVVTVCVCIVFMHFFCVCVTVCARMLATFMKNIPHKKQNIWHEINYDLTLFLSFCLTAKYLIQKTKKQKIKLCKIKYKN